MVNVGVREDDGIDQRRVKRKMRIPLQGFVPPAMVYATIEKDGPLADTQEVHGTRDGAGGAVKLEVHRPGGGTNDVSHGVVYRNER
jgi:hypothetical protein